MSMKSESVADGNKLSYVGSHIHDGVKDRDADSWFTPRPYIESVRAVLGNIDLDPYSSETANEIIQADRYFDKNMDALKQTWNADTLFMNPPYSRGVCEHAVDKLIKEYVSENFKTGIVLVNNVTDVAWYDRLMKHAYIVCFTRGRIKFINVDNKSVSGNTRGQCFILVGRGKELGRRFINEFDKHGNVMFPVKP